MFSVFSLRGLGLGVMCSVLVLGLASCEWKSADDFFADGYSTSGRAARNLDEERMLRQNASIWAKDQEQAADWRGACRDLIARIAPALDRSDKPVVVVADQARSTRASAFRNYMMEMLMEDGFIVQPSPSYDLEGVQLIYLNVENVGTDEFPDQLVLRVRVKRDRDFVADANNQYTIRYIAERDDHKPFKF